MPRKKALSKLPVQLALVGAALGGGIFAYTRTPAAAVEGHHENSTSGANWSENEGGKDSSQYSPLKQINKSTVKDLTLAWYYPAVTSGRGFGRFGFNPLIVDGVMYTLGNDFALVALDASTGKEIWKHPSVTGITSRGINYWESKDRSDRRLIYSANSYLQEVDARTGAQITTFGDEGKVDLRVGLGRDPKSIVSIQSGTPGRTFEDLIILGSATGEDYGSPPGDIRAFNVLTGKLVWQFHTVPHPGEPGYETWPPEAYKYAGGTNDWGGMTLDEKRGVVYIPTGSTTYDFYGADRIGPDLYANCLLALDARTGKLKWYFQFVHHDLWDFDAVTSPKLLTVNHDGKMVDIVAQATKQGFLYAFDRDTGKPLWPVEERPVAKSEVPGEQSWPTQPFPTHLPPFARQSFDVKDVNPYTDPEDQARVKDMIAKARKGLFVPPAFTDTLEIPGNNGGGNWGSAASDPTSGRLFILSKDAPTMLKLIAQPPRAGANASVEVRGRQAYEQYCLTCHGIDRLGHAGVSPSIADTPTRLGADAIATIVHDGRNTMPPVSNITKDQLDTVIAYLRNPDAGDHPPQGAGRGRPDVAPPATPGTRYWSGYGTLDTANGLPAIGPPWSTLTAYDMNKGTIMWQVPFGEVKSLADKGIKNTGSYWPRGGPVATAGGIVFGGSAGDMTVRAYDQDNGKVLWEHQLEAAPDGIPSVYEVNGKEYVVFCVRGALASDNLPVNPNTEAQMTPKHDAQGFYVFALPLASGTTVAKK
jgi:quinoprotein glucose dehydrogenase